MKITARGLGLIGLLGGAGGAINAWLCYARFPVPVGYDADLAFSWQIIPAGLTHGAVLAVASVGLATSLWTSAWPVRLVGAPVVGWLAGWLSFISIQLYISFTPIMESTGGLTRDEVLGALVWPFRALSIETLWIPYPHFGLVGLGYYFLLNICRQLLATRLAVHLLLGSVSGALGSWWWWMSYKPWYLSLLHGTLWGSLVGFGVWRSQQALRNNAAKTAS